MSLKEHGVQKFGRLIDQNIAQAGYLSSLIKAEPTLELVAPTNINIVCYRYKPPGAHRAALKALNAEIMLRLQEEAQPQFPIRQSTANIVFAPPSTITEPSGKTSSFSFAKPSASASRSALAELTIWKSMVAR
jgi:hypothetical protein